jgi:TorA maturation chaperone TorD
MHYLSFLEAGTPGEVADLRRGQRDFLARHLNTWADPFTDSLRAAPDSAPYAEIAGWLAEFTKADQAYLSDQIEENNA